MPLKKKKEKTPKKKIIRKNSKKSKIPKAKKKIASQKPAAKVIGIVTHYFPKVRAAVVKLKTPLEIGKAIKIKGHTTDFTQSVTSMQIDHTPITKAKKGDEIGLLVDSRVRKKDVVYLA